MGVDVHAGALEEEFDIVLASTYAQAKAWNVEHAKASSQGLFGIVAEPFETWLAKTWEQNGDGRVFPSQMERLVVAESVIARCDTSELVKSPGLARALSDCAHGGLGIPAFEAAIEAAKQGTSLDYDLPDGGKASFTPAEMEFMTCIDDYVGELNRWGYVETGQALSLLARDAASIWPDGLVVRFLGDAPLTAQQNRFFTEAQGVSVIHEVVESPRRLQHADVEVLRFAFPTGRYAQPSVVLQAIEDAMRSNHSAKVVISSADPLELYRRLAPALNARDITCSAQASKPFANTSFGSSFFAACDLLSDGQPWNKDALTSLLHSAFSPFGKGRVWRLDADLRADRLADRDEVLERLFKRGESENDEGSALQALLALCANPFDYEPRKRIEVAIDGMAQRGLSRSFVQEQRLAFCAFADAVDVLKSVQCDNHEVLINVLLQANISIAVASYEQQAGACAQVRIVDQRRAAGFAPKSADALIVCDLTTASYPLGKRVSASGSILERFDAGPADTPLASARRLFTSLLEVPRDTLVLERCLNDGSANPLYPSAMWEEFVDAYREGDLSSRDDIDNRYQLPKALQREMYDQGEEDLLADLRPGADGGSAKFSEQGMWSRGEVGNRSALVPYKREAERLKGMPRLSASQIETYLDCPYQWFINRRLGTDELDELLGPDKRGTFYHALFERFYLAFGEKVTPANVHRAREVMFGEDGASGLFGSLVAEQPTSPPGRRFAVLPGSTEETELDILRNRVAAWLDFETTFLPGFRPVAFECAISDVEYEGALIRGSIDRIDVNDKGQAVIIDYKGSLKPGHRAYKRQGRKKDSPGEFMADGKMQAALYADIVARAGKVYRAQVPASDGSYELEFGVGLVPPDAHDVTEWPISAVVGELYVSYNKGNKVTGGYSIEAISAAADIPTLEGKTVCALPAEGMDATFEDFIAFNRQRAAQAIESIKAGQVAPHPSGAASCTYCPVSTCEQRS